MMQSFLKINQGNGIGNKINLYRFDDILIYVIIIVTIIKLLKFQILKRKKKSKEERANIVSKGTNNLFFYKNKNLEVKNKSTITHIEMKNKKLKINNNRIKENQIMININYINTMIIKYIKFSLIKSIIINSFCNRKSNILFDLLNFQESKITLKIKGIGYHSLFCNEIKYNFSKINYLKNVIINGKTQNEITYEYYFDQTNNNVELIWDNNINNCGYMFRNCSAITEIDLSNFDTSKVTAMNSMFAYSSSLTSLDLSNFKTFLVTQMNWMFYNCSSLTTLVLSSFDTSKVINMNSMFAFCSSLTSLNLSNFNTSQVNNTNSMFNGCTNLEYINFYNFDQSKLNSYYNMFDDVPENIIICIKETIGNNKILSQINNINCKVIDCSNSWKSKQKKLLNSNDCIDSCKTSPIYKYEYNGKCYDNCKNGILNNDKNKCKCELDQCLLCSNVALNKKLCTQCNIDYYQKENDPLNIGEYIKCYKDPEGYYLDNNIYKQCYYTCKACSTSGNHKIHNCIKCNNIYPIEIKKGNYFNCYKRCPYYYYFDVNDNYICSKTLSCPNRYVKLNNDKMECIKFNYENIMENIITNYKNYNITREKEIEYYDYLLKIIEKGFTEIYETSKIDNGEDEVIKAEKVTVTFTTSQNQINNINKNVTSIDLGECENLLRKEYNISSNKKLYIKKIDIAQEGMKTKKVEYDVYCKLFGTNLIKLNLTVCENSKISIIIPFLLNGNIDEYNSSSGYYNDICYSTTSEYGTDITLKDRQKNWISEDKIICQEDCVFSNYDHDNLKAQCSCNVKESSESFDRMSINKTKLLQNFKDIKTIVNIDFLVCYKKLFKKEGIINNLGFYLLLLIILFNIIVIIVFYIKKFSLLKKKINDIINGIQLKRLDKKLNKSKNKINIKNHKNKYLMQKSETKKMIYSKKNIKKPLKIKNKNRNFNKKIRVAVNINNNINNNNNNIFYNINDYKIKKNYNHNDTSNISSKYYNKRRKVTWNKNLNKQDKLINLMKYIDEEINILPYSLARLYDKRTYCNYYISLLKTKHSLIFALNNNDYNSRIIKIDLFFIGFTIDYFVNALFYNDDTMHKIYKNKGKFDLESQIPIIIYSTLISVALNKILSLLALSNDAIIRLKQSKLKINLTKGEENLKNKLNIQFILYFIISFLFLVFFWYYISIFCVIYKNTQVHLLKDIIMSFALSLVIPFIIYLLPGFFRIPALSKAKNKRVCLYNFNKLLQMF